MAAPSKHLLSIDIFRAVTMLLMIFVNDASSVKHVPEWIDHAPANADAMGFADTIFPAFLFIVGLSLPFAIENRLNKGCSFFKIATYIVSRSTALIVMGFYQVNLDNYNSTFSILPKAVWALIITIAFFLIWLDYSARFNQLSKRLLITAGILLLVVMAFIYRGGDEDNITLMRPMWWGILGIIGWAYLICSFIYLLTKGTTWLLALVLVLFLALNISIHAGILQHQLWIIGDGSSVSFVMFGVVISKLYQHMALPKISAKLWLTFGSMAVLLIVGGLALRPYADGLSKIRSTPAWVLVCTGISIAIFLLAIYFIDIKGRAGAFSWIRAAGTSTLTCYLLPYFQVYLLRLMYIKYPYWLNSGFTGLLRSAVIAFALVWLAGRMEKVKLRLKV